MVIRDIAEEPVGAGERLYTISFGDNIGGPHRDPNQDAFKIVSGPNNIRAEILPGQSEPKVIGGIAIGNSKSEDGIVIVPTKDYSAMHEPQERNKQGDSGGALVDERGRIVGVVSELDATEYITPSMLLEAYTPAGTQPPAISYMKPRDRYHAQRYAPVSRSVIDELAARPPAACS